MQDDLKKHPESDDELPALFRDHLPDQLSTDLLALAHLSDVEEDEPIPVKEPQASGPIRRKRVIKKSNPYLIDEDFNNQMKELDFRTRAWKPFQKKT